MTENTTPDESKRLKNESKSKQDSPPLWLVYSVMTGVVFLIAGMLVLAKVSVQYVEPLFYVTTRSAIATPLLWCLAYYMEGGISTFNKSDLPIIFLLGLLGVGINQTFNIEGLKRSTAVTVSLLQSAVPGLTTIFALIARQEKLNTYKGIGIIFAILGSITMLDLNQANFSSETFVGNILVIINVIAYSSYLVLQKPVLSRGVKPVNLTALVFTIGSILICSAYLILDVQTDITKVPTISWIGIIYAGVGGGALAYAGNIWALKHSSAMTLAAFAATIPPLAVIFAVIFIDEELSLNQIIGGIIIFGGVFFVLLGKKKEAEEEGKKEDAKKLLE